MVIYLGLINAFSFILCFIDKRKAIKHKYRISENMLLLSCLLGGSLGFLISMNLFHHKTKHIKFIICVPLFLLLWIIIIIKMI